MRPFHDIKISYARFNKFYIKTKKHVQETHFVLHYMCMMMMMKISTFHHIMLSRMTLSWSHYTTSPATLNLNILWNGWWKALPIMLLCWVRCQASPTRLNIMGKVRPFRDIKGLGCQIQWFFPKKIIMFKTHIFGQYYICMIIVQKIMSYNVLMQMT